MPLRCDGSGPFVGSGASQLHLPAPGSDETVSGVAGAWHGAPPVIPECYWLRPRRTGTDAGSCWRVACSAQGQAPPRRGGCLSLFPVLRGSRPPPIFVTLTVRGFLVIVGLTK
ncbi:hypothetical protein GCM10010425_68240 [Streptomyces spororaveus]|uniref:Uncharacterized protein n=1 Tax=Streptomyces spororaveus TaxID=284039 RepID=A0ABQ3T362_9ACTN|nr:hypothetical protein Sspor_03850 [Streptomyces spororaveus]